MTDLLGLCRTYPWSLLCGSRGDTERWKVQSSANPLCVGVWLLLHASLRWQRRIPPTTVSDLELLSLLDLWRAERCSSAYTAMSQFYGEFSCEITEEEEIFSMFTWIRAQINSYALSISKMYLWDQNQKYLSYKTCNGSIICQVVDCLNYFTYIELV